MVKRYKGGLMGSTEAVTSTGDARGMWSTVQATQARNTGNWPALLITETPGSGSGAGFANGFMTVSNVSVTDSSYNILNDTPNISTSGGYIKLTGRGFASGCVVYVGGTPATSTTFISSTEVRAQIAAATSNTLMVYVVNPDGSTGIKLNSLVFSGTPTWVTGTTLSTQLSDTAFSINFSATSDSAITAYTVDTGSSLPPGTTLYANGLFTGTVTGISSDTTYSFSVVATDTENQDTSRTFSVTVGTGDAGFYLTSSIFNSDGNVWVRDSSVNNAFVTVGNDTKPTAFSPYNYNWSVLLPSVSDYLTVPAGTDFAYGTGDFTVDGWIYPTAIATFGSIVWSQSVSGTNYFVVSVSTSRSVSFIGTSSGGGTEITGPANSLVTLNAWNHFAITRTSGSVRVYVNGLGGTATSNTTDFTNTSYVPTIGRYTHQGTDVNFTGYISNLRIVKGVAAFTGNFTVPTTPSTVTQSSGTNIAAITAGQTVFLGLQTNRFIDANTTPKTVTNGGTPQIKSFGPFTETDIITGSAYFDGTGDYLTIPDSAALELGAGDFCVECWIYPTSVAGTGVVIDKRSGGYAPILLWRSTSTLQLYMSANGSSWGLANGATVGALVVNQWYHVAIFRVGSSLYTSFNGVVSLVTASGSATPVNNATNWYIGTETNGSTNPWTGYISDLRFVVGSSVYTSANFTPPASLLTTITNTQFLSLQSRIGEVNHRFVDESGLKHIITRTGDVFQGSFSPYSPAGWSSYFNGSSDSLTVPAGTDFAYGTGDFTVEGWFYATSTLAAYGSALWSQVTSGNSYFLVSAGEDANPVVNNFIRFQSSGGNINSSTVFTLNSWNHFAVVRISGSIRVYLNGVGGTSTSNTTDFTNTSYVPNIGRYTGGTSYFPGYISNLRVVKGVGVYTGNFTVPTGALTATQSSGTNIAAITAGQTVFLGLQTNRFIDANTTPKTITLAGTPQIKSFGPFVETDITTGSAYFDGTGDYLTIPDSAALELGAGDFCVECWIYPTSVAGTGVVIDKRSGGYAPILLWRSTSTLQLYMSANGSSWGLANGATVGALVVNQWYHVAIFRVGSSLYTSFNGVVSLVTASGSATPVNNATNWYIGTETNGSTNPWTGYISDLRFVVGSSVYTSANFAPTTSSLSSITNTQFLSLQYRTGEVNHRFVDESGLKNVMLRAGDAFQGSFSPFSPAGWSGYFDGSGDYLTVTGSSNLAFGTSDFTIEMFVWFNSTGQVNFYDQRPQSTNGFYPTIYVTGSAYLAFYTNSGDRITSNSTISAGRWYHLVVSRVSSVTRMFIDGTQQTQTYNDTNSYLNGTTRPTIGTGGDGQTVFLNGYISNLRVLNGTGYTSVTVPTTALTAIANTQLLTLQDNRFKDNSTNAYTITRNADARIHAFSPFRASGAYNPVTHGGSAYFDGTGDAVYNTTAAVTNFGTDDFTVEYWVYPTVSTSTYVQHLGAATTAAGIAFGTGTGMALYATTSTTGLGGNLTVVVNQWNHIAWSRRSGFLRGYVNGAVGYSASFTTSLTETATSVGAATSGSTYNLTGYLSDVTVTKGNAMYTTTSITVPTAPAPLTSNVSQKLSFTHAGIVDYTTRNNIYTSSTTNTRTSNTQSKFGTGSLYFTGSYQYVFIGPGNTSTHPPLLPTIGDYTVECWVYCTASDTTLMCLNTTTAVYAAVRVALNANGSVSLLVSTSSPNVINVASSAGTFAFNTWQHIAVVRYGGTHSVYVNGTSVIASTTIAATTAVQAGTESVLGCIDNRANSDFASFYGGYIDDFRTSRYARYTANFTPPTTAHLTR